MAENLEGSTDLSPLTLALQVAQQTRNGVSQEEISNSIGRLCMAEGMTEEDAQNRVREAISTAERVQIAFNPTPSSGFSPLNQPMEDAPPTWLQTLLAALPQVQPAGTALTQRKRLPDPKRFGGERKEYLGWYINMVAKLSTDSKDFPTDQDVCNYIFSRTEAIANRILTPYMQARVLDKAYTQSGLWQFMDASFKDQFAPERAQDKLTHMKQGRRSVRDYQSDFEEQCLLAGYEVPDQMKLTLFRNGLTVELQTLL